MSAERLIEIPARRGKAARLRRGQSVRVVNTRGQQVVDATGHRHDVALHHLGAEAVEGEADGGEHLGRAPVLGVEVGGRAEQRAAALQLGDQAGGARGPVEVGVRPRSRSTTTRVR
jgi:hypothetical protein